MSTAIDADGSAEEKTQDKTTRKGKLLGSGGAQKIQRTGNDRRAPPSPPARHTPLALGAWSRGFNEGLVR